MDKKEIKAVHDDDLETLLSNLNILNDVKSGKKKCRFCGCVIDLDNLEAIFPDSGDIKFVCSNPECLKQFYLFLEKENV